MSFYGSQFQPILTLNAALEGTNVPDLRELVGIITDSAKPGRKAELVSLLSTYLASDDNLRALWDRLDETQQAALAEVVHGANSKFYQDRFQAKYGKQPNWGTTDRYGYKSIPSPLGLFLYHGVMPNDLKQRLLAFVPPPKPTTLKTLDQIPTEVERPSTRYRRRTRRSETRVEEIPVVRREMEHAALHDIHAVLRLVEMGKVAVSDKTSLPTRAVIKAVGGLLEGGDYYDAVSLGDKSGDEEQEIGAIKAFAWPMIVQGAGLAERPGKYLTLTRAGQKALAASPAEALRTTWEGWLKTTLFDELRRVNHIRGQTGKGKPGLTVPSKRRTVIAKALAACPVDRWVDVNDFFLYMQVANLDFEVTRDLWSLYISQSWYESLGEAGETWSILQGRYILAFLFEYAATLGLIDIAYIPPARARNDYSTLWGTDDLAFFSRYDGLLYFRLTPLGAYCLGVATDYVPIVREVRPILRVLPNRDVVVIEPPLPAADRLLLNTYGEQTSDLVWRLDQHRILSALEAGHTISRLREMLTTSNGQELPATVQQFLKDMEERGNRVQNRGQAWLFECADETIAQLIANDPRTKRYCVAAGTQHLVVPAESESAFRKALRQLGYIIPPPATSRP